MDIERPEPQKLTDHDRLVYAKINILRSRLPEGIHLTALSEEQQENANASLTEYLNSELEKGKEIILYDASHGAGGNSLLLSQSKAIHIHRPSASDIERYQKKQAQIKDDQKNSLPLFVEEMHEGENFQISLGVTEDIVTADIHDNTTQIQIRTDGMIRPRPFFIASLAPDDVFTPSDLDPQILFARVDKNNPIVNVRRSRTPRYQIGMTNEWTDEFDPSYESTFWINDAIVEKFLD